MGGRPLPARGAEAAGPVAPASPAAVFQYAVPVAAGKPQPSEAFLWVPPDARRIRGVVMAGMTLMEREFVKDPQVRRACTTSSWPSSS